MGVATNTTQANKLRYKALIDRYNDLEPNELRAALHDFLHRDADINVVQPINQIHGADEFIKQVLDPMLAAFDHLYRRTDMMFGGEYEGSEWVVSHGHYVGDFHRDWMGIPASKTIAWLHYAEYHRMEDGKAVESYLYLDMLDLLRQIGRFPLRGSIGYEGFVPGPATCDGIVLQGQDADESRETLRIVDEMLSRLYTDDEEWRPYWHRNMYWYGPSGYGSQLGIEGFNRFQRPYESIFDKDRVCTNFRKSGDAQLDDSVNGHFARFADGNFAALGGWPSHGGYMVNDWLGIKANGQLFTVRVADLYRRQGDLLVENWVFVDIIDMLLQLGVDVFADAGIGITLQR